MYLQTKAKYRMLANRITLARFFLAIPILIALTLDKIFIAWLVILLGGILDWLDGFFARKADGGNKWGAIFDPLADKILLLAPLIWLSKIEIIPFWSVWILFSRELLITSWRQNDHKGGPASLSGKAKTLLQFISVIFILWPPLIIKDEYLLIIRTIGIIFYWLSLLLALYSAYKYFRPNSIYRQD
ncbi:CDP-diacylglycerol--glycerol-3-phosphate 3-phosphatidyltransferase [Prochlorococcus marinus]|uniref:CDP-diacylglycerol--glycerol-3-phosphate 3-phosphatidyltransferase n=1 Tax=Prochlorococcus marinus TaxID=1219 RepID=UPI0022B4C9E0|nr:CDP-diacylglycerol--glycerol-3-phosphate 3-phosphatidyltransferase [Prochlorococcus marinus]